MKEILTVTLCYWIQAKNLMLKLKQVVTIQACYSMRQGRPCSYLPSYLFKGRKIYL